MAAEEEVVCLEDEQGTISGVSTENEQYGADAVDSEVAPEDAGDDVQFVEQDEDDADGIEIKDGDNEEKNEDNMVVVDDVDNDDIPSDSDQG